MTNLPPAIPPVQPGCAHRLLRLPRLLRILLVAVGTLAVVFTLSPFVDQLYLRYFYTPTTVIWPSYISISIGLGWYLVGWWLLVGPRGKPLPFRQALWVYLILTLLAFVGALVLVINGLATIAASPTEAML